MSRYPRSRGFTLVELLVVIAIIGTLVALLLPAVQGAREAARRMSCSNNLHNLALASQQYHDAIGQFPSAWVTYAPGGSPSDSWGWGALILPWLDQKNLYDALGVARFPLGLELQNEQATQSNINVKWVPGVLYQTPLKIFICPSDTGYSQNHLVPEQRIFTSGGGATITPAVSNYVAAEGHLAMDYWNAMSQKYPNAVQPNTGVMWGDSYCRMADIVDGTSNTIMFGERESLTGRGAAWLGVDAPQAYSQQGASLAVAHSMAKINQIEDPILQISWNTQFYGPSDGFTSLHPNGIQTAFCDGSVRWINNQIQHAWQTTGSPQTAVPTDARLPSNGLFQRLMSRADRLPINADY